MHTLSFSQVDTSTFRHSKAWCTAIHLLLCLLVFSILALAGCGGENAPQGDSGTALQQAATVADAGSAKQATGSEAAPVSSRQATAQLVDTASTVPRKIIYNATVDLVSDNFQTAQQNLRQLVSLHKGYVAETEIGGAAGAPREGSWKVRIPAEAFEAFLVGVAKLGELQSIHTDSQDVTAEYYDLQARISNKQVEEKRLIQHLQTSTAKLTDILQVERELSRVRGEIEQMQGRLRVLANMTALTTVTISIHEVKDYVPSRPTTFSAQIARTFAESLSQLGGFGRGLVLLFVAVAPWLLVLTLIGLPAWRISRGYRERWRQGRASH